jgi:hypothetical protein
MEEKFCCRNFSVNCFFLIVSGQLELIYSDDQAKYFDDKMSL